MRGGDDQQAERLRVAERPHRSPMPVIRQRSGVELARTSAPSLTASARSSALGVAARGGGREPQRRGRVGRAAAHAGRDRHVLGDRDAHRRRVPAGRPAEAGERARGEVLALDAGADDLVAAPPVAGSSSSSSASETGCTSETSGW